MKGHEVGDVVAGRYRVVRVLGRGGAGTTYEAEDERGTRVAVKQLRLWHEQDWKALELFQREARTLQSIDHANIPKYVDYVQQDSPEGASFYLVQQLAEGMSLTQWVQNGWRPTEVEVSQIARELLRIVGYLHSLSPPVVHRDVKPDNVIRRQDGMLSLVDFGAVRDAYRGTLSQGSTIVGTFGYMAPEQFRGHAVAATDLYGIGATLLFLLARCPPGELPSKRGKIDFRRHVSVSKELAQWLERMLSPEIEDRFPSAYRALMALERKESASKTSAKRVVVVAAIAAGLVVPVVAGATYAVGRYKAWVEARQKAASGSGRGSAATRRAFDAVTQKSSGRLRWERNLAGHWSAVFGVTFVPGRREIVTSSHDGSARVWNWETGEAIRAFAAHARWAARAAVSSDGKTLVTGGERTAKIWSLETGELRQTIADADTANRVTSLLLTPDDGVLVSAGFGGRVRMWDVAGAKLLREAVLGSPIYAAAVSPDGAVLAFGTKDGSIHLVATATAKVQRRFKAHERAINDLAFTPDGKALLSASDDKLAKVTLVESGKQMMRLEGHTDEVWAIAVAPGGNWAVTGSKDQLLIVWDIFSGKQVDVARGDGRGVIDLSFEGSGSRLAVGGASVASLWQVREPSWRPPRVTSAVQKSFVADAAAPHDAQLVAEAGYRLDRSEGGVGLSEIRALLARALGENPKNCQAHAELARVSWKAGYLHGWEYKPEALTQAHVHIDRALGLDARCLRAHVNRGYAHIFGKDLVAARKSTEEAIKLAPESDLTIELRSSLAAHEEKYDELFTLAKQTVETRKDPMVLANAYSNLATVYRMRAEYDAVEETYASLLKLDPTSAYSKDAFAHFLVWRQKYDEAIGVAQAAIAQMNFGAARRTLARAYAQKALHVLERGGKNADVDRLLELAENAKGHTGDVHYARAMQHEKNGNPLRARLELEQALRVEPDHSEAKAALARK